MPYMSTRRYKQWLTWLDFCQTNGAVILVFQNTPFILSINCLLYLEAFGFHDLFKPTLNLIDLYNSSVPPLKSIPNWMVSPSFNKKSLLKDEAGDILM